MGFDEEFKWCTKCKKYVKYLQSSDSSFCILCGSEVILFSEEDWEKIQASMASDPKSSRRWYHFEKDEDVE